MQMQGKYLQVGRGEGCEDDEEFREVGVGERGEGVQHRVHERRGLCDLVLIAGREIRYRSLQSHVPDLQQKSKLHRDLSKRSINARTSMLCRSCKPS